MKTYSVDELCNLLGLHRTATVVKLRKMHIDPDIPIEEIDAKALAEEVHRPWPEDK